MTKGFRKRLRKEVEMQKLSSNRYVLRWLALGMEAEILYVASRRIGRDIKIGSEQRDPVVYVEIFLRKEGIGGKRPNDFEKYFNKKYPFD